MTKSDCGNKKQGMQPEQIITLDDGTKVPIYQDTLLSRMMKKLPPGGNNNEQERINSD